MSVGDGVHVLGPMSPRVVTAGVPMRMPLATIGGRGSNGMVFLFTVMSTALERLLGVLAGEAGRVQVDQEEVVVGAARDDAMAALLERRARAPRRSRATAPLVGAELRLSASSKATALAAMTCTSGPPWRPGKTVRSRSLAKRSLHRMHAAARAAQRLVGGGGDEVGVRHRARVQPGGDRAGDVRDVDHEQRARPSRRWRACARSR